MKLHEPLCQHHKCNIKDKCKRYQEVINEHRYMGNFHQVCDKQNNYKYFRDKNESKNQ
ncbi:hypothetical protein [Clostridium sp.]|uniref:hypothetical protein n=1 Tax=Clostridium sp. TaxID=1506 RepID=UPI002609C6BE|nr:hypothetical protein [Clostridium sp.]